MSRLLRAPQHEYLYLKSGFVKAPLANGIGRCVPQCQRMTIKFCLNDGGSRGVRDFIQHDLVDFARNHPGTVLYLKPRRHRSPVLVSEYLNGGREWFSLHNMERLEVFKWIESYRTQAGYGPMHYKNYTHTEIPSIQGVWTPFTHTPPNRNVFKYPQEALSTPLRSRPTTSEILTRYNEIQDVEPAKVENHA